VAAILSEETKLLDSPQSALNAISGTHPLIQSNVILNRVKDLRLLLIDPSGPTHGDNRLAPSRTNLDSNPSRPGSSIQSTQSSLLVSSPSVPSRG
jgi:hypothetical protein